MTSLWRPLDRSNADLCLTRKPYVWYLSSGHTRKIFEEGPPTIAKKDVSLGSEQMVHVVRGWNMLEE